MGRLKMFVAVTLLGFGFAGAASAKTEKAIVAGGVFLVRRVRF
jgi:hypothetical protein